MEREEAVQQTAAITADEVAQLKATVAALRDQLEQARVVHDNALQAERQAAQDEIRQLRETIQALRDQLEAR